jgi:hypothetical protein
LTDKALTFVDLVGLIDAAEDARQLSRQEMFAKISN